MKHVRLFVNHWTERDAAGRVWLCWYERPSDPRESRSIITRTLIGIPSEGKPA